MFNRNCTSFPAYADGTSSANPSAFSESTAPNGNLASIMRNWVVVLHDPTIGETDSQSPRSNPDGNPSEGLEV